MPLVNKSAWELIQVPSHHLLSVDGPINLPVELPLVVLQWDSLASLDTIESGHSSNTPDLSDRRQLSGPKIWHCENDQSTD